MKNFTQKFFTALCLLLVANVAWAQCVEYTSGPYTDLSPAPCAEDCGTNNVGAFGAWGNEAYVIESLEPGAEYVFSICNGFVGAWEPVITAFDEADDTQIFGFTEAGECELVFTVPTSYTAPVNILITVSIAGDCGGATVETDNSSTVEFGCGPAGGQQACPAEIACDDPSVSVGTINAPAEVCFGDGTNITIDGAVAPNEGDFSGFAWFVASSDLTGSTNPAGEDTYFGAFPVQATAPSSDDVLNLINDETQLPSGSYFFCATVFGNATSTDGSFNTIVPDESCISVSCAAVTLFADGEGDCPDCPIISTETSVDCGTEQFVVIINVEDMVDATEIIVSDGTDEQSTTTVDLLTFGPYPVDTPVEFTINTGIPSCDLVGTFNETCSDCPGDACDFAIDISEFVVAGTTTFTTAFDNTCNSVDPTDPPMPDCFLEPDFGGEAVLDNTLWFSFVGDGSTYFIESNDCQGTLTEDEYIDFADTQFQLYTGECGDLVAVPGGCNEDGPNSTDSTFPAAITVATEVGVTYYLLVDGFDGAEGSFCLEFSEVEVSGCEDISLGTPILASSGVCFGDTMSLTFDGVVIPFGDIQGLTAVLSSEDITGTTDPVNEASYLGAFGVVTNPEINFIIPNDGAAIPAGTYYITPLVFANGINEGGVPNPGIADITLDPDCTIIGESILFTLYTEDEPLCDLGCPIYVVDQICDDAGENFDIEFAVNSLGEETAFDVAVGGAVETITAPGIYTYGPFVSGTNVDIIVTTSNPDCNETISAGIACPSPCERITDGSFELGAGGGSWIEASSNFGTPLCNATSCGASSIPFEGDWHIWFGGIDASEIGSVSQAITIASFEAELSFYLQIPAAAGTGSDFMSVSIDGVEQFSVTDSDAPDYAEYTLVTLDISAFADDGVHTLSFDSEVFGGGTTNFFVDNVSVVACGDICIADAGTVDTVEETDGGGVTATASGFTDSGTTYNTLYFLVNADGSIYSNSGTGVFPGPVPSGSYDVYTVTVVAEEFINILSATTIDEIDQLINIIGICGDISEPFAFTITGLNDINNNPNFLITDIAPVPTSNVVNVTYNNLIGSQVSVNIFDVTGRLVNSQQVVSNNGINNLTIDASAFTAGVYYIHLTNGNDTTVGKIVKN